MQLQITYHARINDYSFLFCLILVYIKTHICIFTDRNKFKSTLLAIDVRLLSYFFNLLSIAGLYIHHFEFVFFGIFRLVFKNSTIDIIYDDIASDRLVYENLWAKWTRIRAKKMPNFCVQDKRYSKLLIRLIFKDAYSVWMNYDILVTPVR